MIAANEHCEIRAGGGIFRDWTSVMVQWAAGQQFCRCVVSLAEVGKDSILGGSIGAVKLKPGDPIDVYLGGQPAIQGGVVVTRQVGYDAHRHGVQIEGASRQHIADDSSAEPKQYRDKTLEDIAKDQLGKLGIGFKLVNPPRYATQKFKNVIVAYGETVRELVERLAWQRACWIMPDVGPTVLAGRPEGGGGATLVEGQNILACTAMMTDRAWAEKIKGRSQHPGDDEINGRRVAEPAAFATNSGFGVGGKQLIFISEEPLVKDQIKGPVAMQQMAMAATKMQINVTHQGWFKPGSGGLWKLGESVTLRSPMALPSGQATLKVWSVTCQQDSQSGTTTTVELVDPASYGEKYGSSDPGMFQPSEPQLETPT